MGQIKPDNDNKINVQHSYELTDDVFSDLQNWYRLQCNEDWELYYGISIETTDSVAWRVEIDLVDTELQSQLFATIIEGEAAADSVIHQDWLKCCVNNGKFIGEGSINQLSEIISVFLAWAVLTDDSFLR